MTLSRCVSQKSMSKSGIDTRSGLRKRSNSRPSAIGSRSVMVSDQATTEPAREPRPGPTGMSLAVAHRMVRSVACRVRISRGVGRNEWQIAGVGEIDQRILGRFLDRVMAADDLNVEPPREQALQTVEIRLGLTLLSVGKQPRERALGA